MESEVPESQPIEVKQVNGPEIEEMTPHPDTPMPKAKNDVENHLRRRPL